MACVNHSEKIVRGLLNANCLDGKIASNETRLNDPIINNKHNKYPILLLKFCVALFFVCVQLAC